MSSKDLINFLYIYPVSEVLTAVSMRPSRPPIAWKKNSSGLSPIK
jgi:hypothetical protein